jgi:beta-phosphoglucomutase-like phosphatase (HAD superfamily)
MTAEEKNTEKVAPTRARYECALILELENIALESRETMFSILEQSLKAYDKDLSVALFSRFCLYERPEIFIPKLLVELGVGARSSDKILKEFKEGMDAYWKSEEKQPRAGLEAFLNAAAAAGFAQIALTALPEKTAAQLVRALGPEFESLEIHSFAEQGKVVAGADIWMQSAMDRDINPAVCLGLASSSKACRAALAADLFTVAVSDRFTAYQDFGGASELYDSLADADAQELIKTFYQNSDD